MPRPCKCRRIAMRPEVAAFKPAGIPGRELEAITLGLDEMEALRLADLEGLYHEAAAQRMSISRATFGRLLEEARRKVVSALFGSKMLVFEGGPIIMAEMRTFCCDDCSQAFQEPFGTGRPAECPHCHGHRFHRAATEAGHRGRHGGGCGHGTGDGGRCCRRRAHRGGGVAAATGTGSVTSTHEESR
jgi:uncharacterized protein